MDDDLGYTRIWGKHHILVKSDGKATEKLTSNKKPQILRADIGLGDEEATNQNIKHPKYGGVLNGGGPKMDDLQ